MNVERFIHFVLLARVMKLIKTEQFLNVERSEWDLNLADCFPLALVDILNRNVRRYSSVCV